ncbi:helix-turn-helix transcriptional regulator [Arthrobacter sp. ISL-65]|uniref:helix-turn-helix transcriptional regulator n=1 Tax=Arthrobacter sp. ISL-65 TaxID=2819112 RepID=UPI001BE93B41|nr:helix-turn-helix transcriptional regulator [Arthrobacter sp. ISL-65]MBT2547840.1 helix-turn-helix transcriptional regulator [Arthrobacter sp. ISL-65]
MSLRYALLALLTSQPLTGYDVLKHFEQSVGYVWHAPDSQIYPELRRMEKDGLLNGVEEPWGTKGKKKRYHITPEGVEAFRSWMNTTLDYARERDPIHLKAAYLEWADPDQARNQMHAHIAYHSSRAQQWREMIAALEDRSNPILATRLAAAPKEDWTKIAGYKIFTYEGMIDRAKAEIEWARRGLDLIDKLES